MNYFKNHRILTSKNGILDTLSKNHINDPDLVFTIHPLSFKVTYQSRMNIKGMNTFEMIHKLIKSGRSLKDQPYKVQKKMSYLTPCLDNGKNIWILKPTGMNRGNGISLFRSIEQLKAKMDNGIDTKGSQSNHNKIMKKYLASIGKEKKEEFIIQKYIERPLLYLSRKFDIRVWVLITQRGSYYYFPASYVRLSGHQYDPEFKEIENNFIHLTNNAIQKHDGLCYGKGEEANIISLAQLIDHFKKEDSSVDWNSIFFNQIKKRIKQTLKGTWDRLDPSRKGYSFQLLGFDFMIDEALHCWLIEVNNNPCLDECNSLLRRLIPRMLHDTLKLTVDKDFKPVIIPDDKYKVEGYSDSKVIWYLIF